MGRLRQIVTLRRIVISALLGIAVAGLVLSMASTETDPPTGATDAAIEALHPPPDGLELRQTRIGIDLTGGYDALLTIDGITIPEDQLERVEGLSQVFYTPGPGTETGPLEPGEHCATARYWQPSEGSASEVGRSHRWCFNLH